jgi:hypothetical protein
MARFRFCAVSFCLEGFDVRSLQALGALLDGKFDLLAFVEVAEAITLDSGEVDEYIRAAVARNETIAFATVEPFDRTDYTFRHFCLLAKKKKKIVRRSMSFRRWSKKRLKGSALSRRLQSTNENLLASYTRQYIRIFYRSQVYFADQRCRFLYANVEFSS